MNLSPKQLAAENYNYYQELFKQLLDLKGEEAAEAVFGCIQTLKADFFAEA
jgi:hypothetical protein